ncbi:MAG: chemotaxis protein CheW [Desulfarculaceae bacterium]|nr:chemotaxis protein CheW [Desulfarculaceae bacterium]MCF8073923.1 chemotaxis protein CheW [Desulfarculaceae bacterium]MCF8102609.1 chemotaxis protein CheW [Desulfarculaceae bacterium]MCF8117622.1 chemotaxis protein CheW [Desulfarculaceae bacterium]
MAQLPISRNEQLPWVILRLGRHRLALSARHVREMAAMPPITEVPGDSPLLRGMIDLRGELLPLMDLRRMLGLPSLEQQLGQVEAMLEQVEGEHRTWLADLCAAVAQGRPFTRAMSPEECSFGRWYAGFSTDDPHLVPHIAALDSPHRQVHAAAGEVASLLDAGLAQQAGELLERQQGGVLARLLRQLDSVRSALAQSRKEIAVVVDSPEDAGLALAVDEVVAVEEIISGAASLEQADLGPLNRRLLAGVGQRLTGGDMVFLLEMPHLLEQGRALAGQS